MKKRNNLKLKDMKKIEHPLMYKGYLIKQEGDRLSAENLATGHKFNPIFKSFDILKAIIDSLNLPKS